MVNRTQTLVLGFFLVVLVSVVAIRVAAPEVYDQALRLPSGDRRSESIFLAALVAFIVLLAGGVFRRWRWTFWLITVAFLSRVLRVPVVILQLMGFLAGDAPTWYLLFQGLLGLVQFAIGLAMLAGYRRAGVWGAVQSGAHEFVKRPLVGIPPASMKSFRATPAAFFLSDSIARSQRTSGKSTMRVLAGSRRPDERHRRAGRSRPGRRADRAPKEIAHPRRLTTVRGSPQHAGA